MNTLMLLLSLLQAPDTAHVQPSFTVGAYVVRPTGQLRVAVDNHGQRRLSIRLVNPSHQVLYEDLTRRSEPYRRLLNLSELPEGDYVLQISDGQQTVTHSVRVGAPVPVQPVRYISLRADQ